MFSMKNDLQRTTIIAFLLFVSTLVGYFYVGYYSAVASFWPAAGFYVAFYYLYKKKALPGILIGLIIANLGYRIFNADEEIWISFVLTFVFVTGHLAELFVFNYLLIKMKSNMEKLNQFKNGLKFVGSAIAAVLVGSLISVTALMIAYGTDDIFTIYFRWAIGDFTGIVIFGSLIFYAYYRDDPIESTFNYWIKSAVYLFSFVACLYFVFSGSGNDYLTFENFQISFVILYIIAAFVFSYRMIILNNLVFLSMMFIFHVIHLPSEDIVLETVWLSIYIMTLSSIASIVRNVLQEKQKSFKDLEHARNNLEKIIVSTNNLFNIENKLPEEVEAFSRRYLEDMFNLACDIYPKFRKASCYIKGNETVEYIETLGYDKDFLNSLQFEPSVFTWDFDVPKIVIQKVASRDFQSNTGLKLYQAEYSTIVESIRFTVQIGENQYGGMSFDIIDKDEHFDEHDLENFASFQTLVNSYYSIGILNTQKNNLKDDIVLSLVRTLELYDLYTGGHSEEVAELSTEIARELKLSDEEIRETYWAGIVHDIGKIGLPIEVLNKKGRLTDEEYNKVKEHSMFGYNILKRSDDLKTIATIVRHHHEWWNGSGYPDGLRGIDIPYSSQILHVCDAVSAMATKRVYSDALSLPEIIDELQNGLGKQFSPKVAKYMIKFIQDGKFEIFFKNIKK